MQVIPTQPIPNQTLQAQLNGQACTIDIFQYAYGLFLTLTIGTAPPIVASVIGENLNRIVRDLYLGFVGDLSFVDTQGQSNPIYTGLGSRWQLVYLTPADLAALGLTG